MKTLDESIQESKYIGVPQYLEEDSGARNFAHFDRNFKRNIYDLLVFFGCKTNKKKQMNNCECAGRKHREGGDHCNRL